MLKLYKFRSLGDGCENDPPTKTPLGRALTILNKREFWCSSLWEMNDPMEGIFSYDYGALDKQTLADIFSMKNKRRICSFSGKEAFRNPTMWGYYANGFKGMAVEVEVDPQDVYAMTYSDNHADWSVHDDKSTVDEKLLRVLTTKLKEWAHESEYRYICDAEQDCGRTVGHITAVHVGWPYKHIGNWSDIHDKSPSLEKYLPRLKEIIKTAQDLDIHCFGARLDGNIVISEPLNGCEFP